MIKKTLHHICIQTRCYQETVDFYTKIMGFVLIKEDIHVSKRMKKGWLKFGDIMFEVLPPKCSSPYDEYKNLREGMPHLSFQVENIDEAYEEFKTLGFENFKSRHGKYIYKIKGGHQFKMVAPEGTEIEIRDCGI